MPLLAAFPIRESIWSDVAALVRSLCAYVANQYNDENTKHPSELDSNPSDLKITELMVTTFRSGLSYFYSAYVDFCLFLLPTP